MPKSAPTIAAIIPARNAAQTLPRTLASVLEQTCPVSEVIVVDDQSSDDTARIARAHAPCGVSLVAGPGQGVAAARNIGMETAGAEWVAFLDADDEWLPGHIESLLGAIARVPGSAACFGAALHVTDDGRLVNRAAVKARYATVEGLLRRRLQPTTSATAVKRVMALQLGGFDEDFRRPAGVEDIDLWWRIAQRWPCAVSPEPQVRYYVHEGRDKARSHAELSDLAADRCRCIERLEGEVSSRLLACAAAQHHAIMARYWYVAGFVREGRREALLSLRWAPSLNGFLSLTFGLVPPPAKRLLRTAWRALTSRDTFR